MTPMIFPVSADDMTREGLPRCLERLSAALAVGRVLLAFDHPVGVAPWDHPPVKYWCGRVALLHNMLPLGQLANENGTIGLVAGVGLIGFSAIAKASLAALGQKWATPHGIEVKGDAVCMRGETLLTYKNGAIIAHEPRYAKDLRAFCAAKDVKVLSVAMAFDGASVTVEVETEIGPILWSMPTADKHQVRLQLTEMTRLAAFIAADVAYQASIHEPCPPEAHPSWKPIVTNNIRAVRAQLRERE